jgi:hypothetical protein
MATKLDARKKGNISGSFEGTAWVYKRGYQNALGDVNHRYPEMNCRC